MEEASTNNNMTPFKGFDKLKDVFGVKQAKNDDNRCDRGKVNHMVILDDEPPTAPYNPTKRGLVGEIQANDLWPLRSQSGTPFNKLVRSFRRKVKGSSRGKRHIVNSCDNEEMSFTHDNDLNISSALLNAETCALIQPTCRLSMSPEEEIVTTAHDTHASLSLTKLTSTAIEKSIVSLESRSPVAEIKVINDDVELVRVLPETSERVNHTSSTSSGHPTHGPSVDIKINNIDSALITTNSSESHEVIEKSISTSTSHVNRSMRGSHPDVAENLLIELKKLSVCGWYWGPLSRTDAIEKLREECDGAFLVRDSSNPRYLLSLSFKAPDGIFHTRIEHTNGFFSFFTQPTINGKTSVISLIETSLRLSEEGGFCYTRSVGVTTSQSFAVRLTKPVSRFTGQVKSLQYLCRFIIRQLTRYDHIPQLPVPRPLRLYIEECPF